MPTDVITRTESRGTGKYEQLLARCKGMTATPTAVAHPCDDASLGAVVEAARAGIIAPILVGPVERIRTVAKTCGLDIEQYEIADVPHSHAATKHLYVVGGSINFDGLDLRAGDGIVIPRGTTHSAVVGPDGVTCVEAFEE